MELAYSKEDETFRKEVRVWLKKNLPKKDKAVSDLMPHDPERVRRAKEWQRKLYEAGYVAMGWPKEYGGQGADVMRQTIVNEELVLARAPGLIGMIRGADGRPDSDPVRHRRAKTALLAQDSHRRGDLVSGLFRAGLGLRSGLAEDTRGAGRRRVHRQRPEGLDVERAVRRLDVLPGPHRSGRAETSRHLLHSHRHEDVRASPCARLIQMTGDAGFNEVFFDNVRVPRANLVGELNQGWLVANATLSHERNMLGSTTRTQQMMQNLIRFAQTRQRYGKPAAQDPVIRQNLADLIIRVEAMKYHSYRQLTECAERPVARASAPSVNKLVSHRAEPRHLCLGASRSWAPTAPLNRGSAHVIDNGVWPYEFMFTLGLIIGGGTSQIQKNIISERGLGMPKSG